MWSTNLSGIFRLSFNHQLTCGFPVTDFWNHRKFRFAISPWQVAMTHSRWGPTRRKQKRQPFHVHCQAGYWLPASYLKPVSLNKVHAYNAPCILWSHTFLRIHFSVSQLVSAGSTTPPGWGLNVQSDCHLPPDAANTEAPPAFSLHVLQTTQFFPLVIVPYLYNVRIHYEGNCGSQNQPLP